MQEKTKRILKAAYDLSADERQQLLAELQNFGRINLSEQRNFSDALSKSLGPLNTNGCPVCGR